MSRYWIRFRNGFPVETPGLSPANRKWVWHGIYGLSIGDWFFGAIKGHQAPSEDG